MEAVVHQTLGQVIHLKTGAAAQAAQIENAFMGHQAALPPEQHGVMGIQTLGEIVGRQQSNRRCLTQPGSSHQAQVHPTDRKNASASQGRC